MLRDMIEREDMDADNNSFFRLESTEDDIPVVLTAVRQGVDLCVSLYGGDKGHIGAVALAQPRPSLTDPTQLSASTSVVTVCGHKEDGLAYDVAESLAQKINGIVTVSCGIHMDNASQQQIQQIVRIARGLAVRLGTLLA